MITEELLDEMAGTLIPILRYHSDRWYTDRHPPVPQCKRNNCTVLPHARGLCAYHYRNVLRREKARERLLGGLAHPMNP